MDWYRVARDALRLRWFGRAKADADLLFRTMVPVSAPCPIRPPAWACASFAAWSRRWAGLTNSSARTARGLKPISRWRLQGTAPTTDPSPIPPDRAPFAILGAFGVETRRAMGHGISGLN